MGLDSGHHRREWSAPDRVAGNRHFPTGHRQLLDGLVLIKTGWKYCPDGLTGPPKETVVKMAVLWPPTVLLGESRVALELDARVLLLNEVMVL